MMQHVSLEQRQRLRELAALFTRLGFTAFGGPAAHVALMEEEIVHRRQWMDRQHFLDLIAAVNFIPGPNSTELAIHIGQLRAGWRGLIVAGVCFICPAMLIILIIAWSYAKWGAMPAVVPSLHAVAAAVLAVIVFAIWRFSITAMKDSFTSVIVVLVTISQFAGSRAGVPQIELLALAASAIAGAIWYRSRADRVSHKLLSLMLPIGFWPDIAKLAAVLFKIGITLFGSGYVLISYLQAEMVDHRGWLTQQQLTDAIAVGQFTPGPLLTTATFVGFLLGHSRFGGGNAGGILGGIVATIAIFLPAFLLVAAFGHLLQKIRSSLRARGALDGMNAAVVGLMILPAVRMGEPALQRMNDQRLDWINLGIFTLCMLGLWKKMNATWLILAAGVVGTIRAF